jgi:hypothetical protein
MKNEFDKAAQKSEAETFLDSRKIAYEKQADGTIRVQGDIVLYDLGMTELPDLGNVVVEGAFDCRFNELTSLKGSPKAVGVHFLCDSNKLTSLEGAPQSVGIEFFCSRNQLTSLKGAPSSISGRFFCDGNPLTYLEGAPQEFKGLYSDLGGFKSWQEVPEELRYSPETRARMEEERIRLVSDPHLRRAIPAPRLLVPKK